VVFTASLHVSDGNRKLANDGTCAAPSPSMRVPLFRDRPTYEPPRSGSLQGQKVLFLTPVLEADLEGLNRVARALKARGVEVQVASECHGEVRGGRQAAYLPRILGPNLLTCEVRPANYDAIVVVGGKGAETMAKDQLSCEVVRAAAQFSRPVFALGEGLLVLQRAGLHAEALDPRAMVHQIFERLRPVPDRTVLQPA
jgi:hypothetical protein